MKTWLSKAISVAVAVTFASSTASCIKSKEATKDATVLEKETRAGEKKKSREEITRECRDNLTNLDAAVDAFSSGHRGRYPGSPKELVPEYINRIPNCPLNGAAYRYDPTGKSLHKVSCPNGHGV